MADWTEADLFRPFAQILHNVRPNPLPSYFDDDFYDFEGTLSAGVVWDLPLLAHAADASGSCRILDVGCGSGRVGARLAAAGGREVVGIDSSRRAIAAARASDTRPVTWIHGEVAAEAPSLGTFDLAVMGSVTINSFRRHEDVAALLHAMDRCLRDTGELVILIFASSELRRFERFTALCDGLPFLDREDKQRFILRGIDYEPATRQLRHNYFIPGIPGSACAPGPGVITVHLERVWTIDELGEIAATCGWTVRKAGTTRVADGGADGWICECYAFRR